MQTTKFLTALAALAFAVVTNVMAQTPAEGQDGHPPRDFAKEKANILQHLQKMTNCINAAQSEADLKTCHEQNRPPHPPRGTGPSGPQS